MTGEAFNDEPSEVPVESAAQEGSQETRVLALLRSEPEGLTDQEIAARLGLVSTSAVARRNTLVRRGLVQDSGRRRQSGNVVWLALPEAGAAVAAPLPVVPKKTSRRLTYEKNRAEVERLLREGKNNVEIAEILGISTSAVSNAKSDLEGVARIPGKLDRDLDRFDSTLTAAASVASDLAKRLEHEAIAKDQEELRACEKNLAESLRRLRALQTALKKITL